MIECDWSFICVWFVIINVNQCWWAVGMHDLSSLLEVTQSVPDPPGVHEISFPTENMAFATWHFLWLSTKEPSPTKRVWCGVLGSLIAFENVTLEQLKQGCF